MAEVSERVEHVRRWRESGQTTREYAQGHGLNESSLRYWVTRYRGIREVPRVALARVSRPGGREPEALGVVPIVGAPPVVSPVPPGEGVALELGAVRIVVRRGFDAELLRQVIAALGVGR